jgi:hypothetical protein
VKPQVAPPVRPHPSVGFASSSNSLIGAIDIGSNFQKVNENLGYIGSESLADILNSKIDILLPTRKMKTDRLL